VKIPTTTGVDTTSPVASSSIHDVSLASIAAASSSERSSDDTASSSDQGSLEEYINETTPPDVSIPLEIVGQGQDDADDELGQFLLQAFDEFEHKLDAAELFASV
jgi:hypothetical protein